MRMGTLFTDSSGCNSYFGHIPLPAAKVRCLCLSSSSLGCCFWAVSPIDQCHIWDQICLEQTSGCAMGRAIHLLATDLFQSCVGAQPAPATGPVLAHELLWTGILWARQQTERPELCTSNCKVFKGIQLFSSSEPYCGSSTSTHLFTCQFFSCIECAFHDNNFCPHFEHTNYRSLQACC